MKTFKRFTHFFHRRIQKIGIFILRKLNPVNRVFVDESENDASRVFKVLLNDENTKILVLNYNEKFYLSNDIKDMIVVLQPDTIRIVNHKYSYFIPISDHTHKRLLKNTLDKISRDAILLDEKIAKNNKNSIRSILGTISVEPSSL